MLQRQIRCRARSLLEVGSRRPGQPLILDGLERAGILELGEHLIDAADQRVVLLEEQAELLAAVLGRELTDDLALGDLHRSDVVGRGQIDHDAVDLAVLERRLGVIGVVVDVGLVGRLDDISQDGMAVIGDIKTIYSNYMGAQFV